MCWLYGFVLAIHLSPIDICCLRVVISHWCFIPYNVRSIYNEYVRLTMMTSSNENIFRVTGHLCGEFPGPRWIPHTKASNAEL